MRRIGRHRRKKQKKILIIGSLSILLFLCVGYAAFSTNLNIKAKGNVKEQTRIIQAWDENSQTDFHSDFYKDHVVSVTFLDNNNIPSNATESWNVSEDKENGEVMAWVVPNNKDNTKYDLYIGAKGGVIANPNSSYLFYLCTGLEIIDFNNNFDTRYVTDMNHMFSGSWSEEIVDIPMLLKEIRGLENFDTSNVISMSRMFLYCSNLTSLNVSNFNTSNVVDMGGMFNQLDSLKTIDLSNFDTSNVTNMYAMFAFNSKLKNLNLCSFNTRQVSDMRSMFVRTYSLEHIYVGSNWNTSNADTSGMFSNSNIKAVTTGQC